MTDKNMTQIYKKKKWKGEQRIRKMLTRAIILMLTQLKSLKSLPGIITIPCSYRTFGGLSETENVFQNEREDSSVISFHGSIKNWNAGDSINIQAIKWDGTEQTVFSITAGAKTIKMKKFDENGGNFEISLDCEFTDHTCFWFVGNSYDKTIMQLSNICTLQNEYNSDQPSLIGKDKFKKFNRVIGNKKEVLQGVYVMEGFNDMVIKERMEVLSLVNEPFEELLWVIFDGDHGASSLPNWKNLVYGRYKKSGKISSLVEEKTKWAEISSNGTFFRKRIDNTNEPVNAKFTLEGITLDRWSIQIKLRLIKNLKNWLVIRSTDPTVENKIKVSFDSQGNIVVNYLYPTDKNEEIIFEEISYKEGELLDLVLSVQGGIEDGKFSILLNVNSTYHSPKPIEDPIFKKFADPEIKIQNPVFQNKPLEIYELRLFEGALVGKNCKYLGNCGTSALGLDSTSTTKNCLKCIPHKYITHEGTCEDCSEEGYWYNDETRICMKCNQNCECNNKFPCSKCKDISTGVLKQHGTCFKCEEAAKCKECSVTTSNCTKCVIDNGLIPEKYLEENKCKIKCSPGYFQELNEQFQLICSKCPKQCATCKILKTDDTHTVQCLTCNETLALATVEPTADDAYHLKCKLRKEDLGGFSRKEILNFYSHYFYPHLGPISSNSSLELKQKDYLSKMVHGWVKILPSFRTGRLTEGTHTILRVTSQQPEDIEDDYSKPEYNQLFLGVEVIDSEISSDCNFFVVFNSLEKSMITNQYLTDGEGTGEYTLDCSIVSKEWIYVAVGADLEFGHYTGSVIFQSSGAIKEMRYLIKNSKKEGGWTTNEKKQVFTIRFGGYGKIGISQNEHNDYIKMIFKKFYLDSGWRPGKVGVITKLEDRYAVNLAHWGLPATLLNMIPVSESRHWQYHFIDQDGVDKDIDIYNTYEVSQSMSPMRIYSSNSNLMPSYWREAAFAFKKKDWNLGNPNDKPLIIASTKMTLGNSYTISFWYKPPKLSFCHSIAPDLPTYLHTILEFFVIETGDPLAQSTTQLNPSLTFMLRCRDSTFVTFFKYDSPKGVSYSNEVNFFKISENKWAHYMFVYHRLMGASNVQIFFYKDSKLVDQNYITEGGSDLRQEKVFVLKIGSRLTTEPKGIPDSPNVFKKTALGSIRNTSLFINTAVQFYPSCQENCQVCTNNFDCLYPVPGYSLYNFNVLELCPRGFKSDRGLCIPNQKIIAVDCKTPGLSVEMNSNRFILVNSDDCTHLTFSYQNFADPTDRNPHEPSTFTIKFNSDIDSPTLNQPCILKALLARHKLTGNKFIIEPQSATCSKSVANKIQCILVFKTQGNKVTVNDNFVNIDDKHKNEYISGLQTIKFHILLVVEEDGCPKTRVTGNFEYKQNTPGKLTQKFERKGNKNLVKCHEACESCIANYQSRYACIDCAPSTDKYKIYSNTESRTERICGYNFEDLIDFKKDKMNFLGELAAPPGVTSGSEEKALECQAHVIISFPPLGMTHFDQKHVNLKCVQNANYSHHFGVPPGEKVTDPDSGEESIKIYGLYFNFTNKLVEREVGDYSCTFPCTWYQHIEKYFKICIDGINEMGTSSDKKSYRCCKIKDAKANPNENSCLLSCLEAKNGYLKEANECDRCLEGSYPKVELVDFSRIPISWSCEDTQPCRIPLYDVDDKTAVKFCYDCPVGSYPKITNPPYDFECVECSFLYFLEEEKKFECLTDCNKKPKYNYDSQNKECIPCGLDESTGNDGKRLKNFNPSRTEKCENICEAGSTIDEDGNCSDNKRSCIVKEGDDLGGKILVENRELGYCATCDFELVKSLNKCLMKCGPGLYLLQQDGIYSCVSECPIYMYSNRGEVKKCDKCIGPDLVMNGGRCLNSNCPPGKYKDSLDNYCKPCHETCVTCTNGTQNDCILCSDGFGLEEYKVLKNSEGKEIPRASACLPCSSACIGCSTSYFRNCTLCRPPFALLSKDVSEEAMQTIKDKYPKDNDYIEFRECLIDNCEPGKVLQTGKESQCVLCDIKFAHCELCNISSCEVCKPGYWPVWEQFKVLGDKVARRCASCGVSDSENEPHEDFEYDTITGECKEICGDGKRYDRETASGLSFYIECDDGNLEDGDGCSSNCTVESNYACSGGSFKAADICYYVAQPEAKIIAIHDNVTIEIEFNEEMLVQKEILGQLVKFSIENYTLDTDYSFNLGWNEDTNKHLYIEITPFVSMENVTFTITFVNIEIVSLIGKYLLTTKLEGTIDSYIYESLLDKVFLVFFDFATMPMYITAILILMCLSPSSLHLFFNNIFEILLVFLLQLKYDPATRTIAHKLLRPIICFDIFFIINKADESHLPQNYTSAGLNPNFFINLVIIAGLVTLGIIIVILLKLIASGHEFGKDEKLSNYLGKVRGYMEWSGFLNILRMVFPQTFFICFVFIKNFNISMGISTIAPPLITVILCLVFLVQLFIIGNYSITKNVSKVVPEEKKKKKDDDDSVLEDLDGKTLDKLGGEDDDEEEEKQLEKELELERDFNLAFDEDDQKREMEIKKKEIKKDDEHWKKLMENYNPKFNKMFGEMKISSFSARIYPFFESMSTGFFVFFVAVLKNNLILQNICFMLSQGFICTYASLVKPFIHNDDNMRLICDKILNLLICVAVFVISANDERPFIGMRFKVRFLERGVLAILFFVKVIFNYGYYMYKAGKIAIKIYKKWKLEKKRKRIDSRKEKAKKKKDSRKKDKGKKKKKRNEGMSEIAKAERRRRKRRRENNKVFDQDEIRLRDKVIEERMKGLQFKM